jgi:hypothetical protein
MIRFQTTLRRTAGAFAVVLGVAMAVPGVASAAPAPDGVCSGGSVAAGTYHTLTITGVCSIDSGNVHVWDNLTVKSGGALLAAFGGSDVTVGQNVVVRAKGILVLGCEPLAFTCLNDPDQQVGTLSTNNRIGGSLIAVNALMVLAHNNHITGSVTQSGGGGGANCSNFPLGPNGPPAYSTYEDNFIGAGASVVGVHTCWLGFIRNNVRGNVVYSSNILADPDANEVVTNTIKGNLICTGNNPAAQIGDSGGSPNIVKGRAFGQCRTLV